MALDLAKPVGPLPLGAWAVVIAGGLYIGYTARNGSANTEPVGYVDTSSDAGVGMGGSGEWTNLSPPSVTDTNSVPTTNEEWAVMAIDWLIGQGYPPDISTNAITKALDPIGGRANRLTVQEYSLWRVALRHFGSPPTSVVVKPPHSLPPPITPPKQPPRRGITYHMIKPGETLKSVSDKYSASWQEVKAANTQGVKRADGSNGFIPKQWLGVHPLTQFIGRRLIIPQHKTR